MDVFVVGSQAMQAIGACDTPSRLAFVQRCQPLVSCGGQNARSGLYSLGRLTSTLGYEYCHGMERCYQAQVHPLTCVTRANN